MGGEEREAKMSKKHEGVPKEGTRKEEVWTRKRMRRDEWRNEEKQPTKRK